MARRVDRSCHRSSAPSPRATVEVVAGGLEPAEARRHSRTPWRNRGGSRFAVAEIAEFVAPERRQQVEATGSPPAGTSRYSPSRNVALRRRTVEMCSRIAGPRSHDEWHTHDDVHGLDVVELAGGPACHQVREPGSRTGTGQDDDVRVPGGVVEVPITEQGLGDVVVVVDVDVVGPVRMAVSTIGNAERWKGPTALQTTSKSRGRRTLSGSLASNWCASAPSSLAKVTAVPSSRSATTRSSNPPVAASRRAISLPTLPHPSTATFHSVASS